MKQFLSVLAVGLLVSGLASVADEKKQVTAEDVAKSYFEVLPQGDAEKANALSTVPFSFDEDETFTKKEQVEAKHKEIAGDKGKRAIPKYTVTVTKNAVKLDREVFPEYVVYRIKIQGRDDHIDIYVTTGDDPKVIGFRD